MKQAKLAGGNGTKPDNGTYLSLISKDKETITREDLEMHNEQAKINIQTSILETRKKLIEAKKNVNSAKCAIPFDPAAVVKAHNQYSLAQREMDQYLTMQKELFHV